MKKGFIFSLDAFVAFSLMILAIQSILIMSSTPKAYYNELLQAQDLAKDTLLVLSTTSPPCPKTGPCDTRTYMEKVIAWQFSSDCNNKCKMQIVNLTDSLIPAQYSYAFSYSDLDGKWHTIFNASAKPVTVSSIHEGIPFHRVQATAQSFVIGYGKEFNPGYSPYCNVECKGWLPDLGRNSTPEECNKVPCGIPVDTFEQGEFHVGMIRLTVWG